MPLERHPFDQYTFENGETLRLTNNGILVKMDPVPGEKGKIHFPEGAMDHVNMTGTILAFGYIKERPLPDTTKTKPIKPFPIPDLEVGEKVCFVRFLRLQDSNKKFREMFDDNIITIKPEDILFVFSGKLRLG